MCGAAAAGQESCQARLPLPCFRSDDPLPEAIGAGTGHHAGEIRLLPRTGANFGAQTLIDWAAKPHFNR